MPRYPATEQLLARTQSVLSARSCSAHTQQTHLGWIRRFLVWSGHPHPARLDARLVERFLSSLARDPNVGPDARSRAAAATAFLLEDVLRVSRRPKRSRRPPSDDSDGRAAQPRPIEHRTVATLPGHAKRERGSAGGRSDPPHPEGTPRVGRPQGERVERLVNEARRILRARSYSVRTEHTYLRWIQRFLAWSDHSHPGTLDASVVERFLSDLATESSVAPKTRNQAASAIAFLYREVLRSDAADSVVRARGRSRLPTVLSDQEVRSLLGELNGRKHLVAALLYGTGMRLSEALGLRVKDLDFELARIVVRQGKGGKDRVVMLPNALTHALHRQIRMVRDQHARDRAEGGGWAALPGALARKRPDEGWALGWQYLFSARKKSIDPATGRTGRGPLHPTAVQRAVRIAVRRAGILKPASCHTLRHSFATQMIRSGYDIRVVQELLGHTDVRTTMIYLHVAEQMMPAVLSPLDRPPPRPAVQLIDPPYHPTDTPRLPPAPRGHDDLQTGARGVEEAPPLVPAPAAARPGGGP